MSKKKKKNKNGVTQNNSSKKLLLTILGVVLVAIIAFCWIKFSPQINEWLGVSEPEESFEPVAVITNTDAPKSTAAPPTQKPAENTPDNAPEETAASAAIDRNGSYFDKDHVALYIITYGELPPNYITKKEAQALGWSGGSVQKYAPGKAIGGDTFTNSQGVLPKTKGVTYKECDIDTDGESKRGAKRIVFGSDGRVFFTEDHYETFLEYKDGKWVGY